MTKKLEELVAGDQVVISAGYDNTWLDTVVKVTKTQIVVSKGARYNRTSGLRCGETGAFGGHSTVKPATPESIEQVQRRFLIRQLMGLRREQLQGLTTEVLRQIYAHFDDGGGAS